MMEMLIAIFIAGILTLIILKIIFPNAPENSRVFDEDEQKKLQKKLYDFASKVNLKKKTTSNNDILQEEIAQLKISGIDILQEETTQLNTQTNVNNIALEKEKIDNIHNNKANKFSWSEVSSSFKIVPKKNKVHWEELSSFKKIPSEINNQTELKKKLQRIVGTRDRVSGEILKSGQKVYVCLDCKLGYHEDSWYYINQMCEQCKANHNQIKSYILPRITTRNKPAQKKKINQKANQPKSLSNNIKVIDNPSPKVMIEKKDYSFKKTLDL